MEKETIDYVLNPGRLLVQDTQHDLLYMANRKDVLPEDAELYREVAEYLSNEEDVIRDFKMMEAIDEKRARRKFFSKIRRLKKRPWLRFTWIPRWQFS